MHKVTRHVLDTRRSDVQDRPTRISSSPTISTFIRPMCIEDADGSLIVVDTGGWYKLCCPTSQLHKPDVLGAIYRVRRTGRKAHRRIRADRELTGRSYRRRTGRAARRCAASGSPPCDPSRGVRRRGSRLSAASRGSPSFARVLVRSGLGRPISQAKLMRTPRSLPVMRRNAAWALTRRTDSRVESGAAERTLGS